MTKRTRFDGPQALAAQAQYLLNQRRTKLWMPFLEAKIAELQARIQEKGSGQA
jgi:CRISPR/Cas system-associated endonuclease Cas1